MLRPLHELSRTSPPCLLCNYVLRWGSPRCSLSLFSEWRAEKRKMECGGIKGDALRVPGVEGAERVGVLLRMMGILLPGLLQRRRGLRGICLKVKGSHHSEYSFSVKRIFLFFFFPRLNPESTFAISVCITNELYLLMVTAVQAVDFMYVVADKFHVEINVHMDKKYEAHSIQMVVRLCEDLCLHTFYLSVRADVCMDVHTSACLLHRCVSPRLYQVHFFWRRTSWRGVCSTTSQLTVTQPTCLDAAEHTLPI